MKNTLILLTAIFGLFTTLSASSNLLIQKTSESRTIEKFKKINVGSIFNVEYTYSQTVTCVVSGEVDYVKRTKLSVRNGVLCIDLEDSRKNNNENSGHLTVRLTGPEFEGADISGVAEFTLIGEFPKAPVALFISGCSEFKGKINATTFEANFSGTADVQLSGQCEKSRMNICGTVELKAPDFTVNDLSINISGTASVKISVIDKLDAHTSGVSSLVYIGNPTQLNKITEGLSTIDRE